MANNQLKGEKSNEQLGETEGDTEKVPLHSDNENHDGYEQEPPPAYNPDAAMANYDTNINKTTTTTTTNNYNNNNKNTNTGVNEPLRRDNDAAPPAGVVIIPMSNIDTNTNINNKNINSSGYPGTQYNAGYNKVQVLQQPPPARHYGHPPPGPHHHGHVHPPPAPHDGRNDDPTCLYVLAVFALFIPLVGWIGMCAYQCGNGLGPRQTGAFRILSVCTLVGMIIGIIYYSSG